MRLQDKVALITGSAGGMGKAAAELFAREGASIIVTDVVADAGEETARGIREAGGKAIFVKADVSKEDDVKHLVARGIDAFGSIDVLYNNAGIMPTDDGGVTNLSEAVWDRIMDVNLKSAYFCAKHVVPHMLEKGKRFYHQRGVICGAAGLHGAAGRLYRVERRYALHYQVVRHPVRAARRALQCHLSGADRNAAAARAVDKRRSSQSATQPHSDGAFWRNQ